MYTAKSLNECKILVLFCGRPENRPGGLDQQFIQERERLPAWLGQGGTGRGRGWKGCLSSRKLKMYSIAAEAEPVRPSGAARAFERSQEMGGIYRQGVSRGRGGQCATVAREAGRVACREGLG